MASGIKISISGESTAHYGSSTQVGSSAYSRQSTYTCPAGKTFVGKAIVTLTSYGQNNGCSAWVNNHNLKAYANYLPFAHAEIPIILQAGESVLCGYNTYDGGSNGQGFCGITLTGVES